MKKSIVKLMSEAAQAAQEVKAGKAPETKAASGHDAAAPASSPASTPVSGDAASRDESAANDRAAGSGQLRAPVVNAMGRALNQLKEDSVVSLDPGKIDPSPFQDRLEGDGEAAAALEELKHSIEAEGQKIPVLVRPHPDAPGRYQLAYGHRRLLAMTAIMAESSRPEAVKIRAHVRPLTDQELIREQSVENGVRENLTFIEQALWARQLKSAGLKQRDMQPILGLSESGISRLLSVAGAIPADIVGAIGRAKNAGRPAWMTFARLLEDSKAVERVRAALRDRRLGQVDGAERLALLTRAARGASPRGGDAVARNVREIEQDGRTLAKLKKTAKGASLAPALPRSRLRRLVGRQSGLVLWRLSAATQRRRVVRGGRWCGLPPHTEKGATERREKRRLEDRTSSMFRSDRPDPIDKKSL